jgi:hypothetical protein
MSEFLIGSGFLTNMFLTLNILLFQVIFYDISTNILGFGLFSLDFNANPLNVFDSHIMLM